MKDSQPESLVALTAVSISRRIMKDSQQEWHFNGAGDKYIKANNERFSTAPSRPAITQ